MESFLPLSGFQLPFQQRLSRLYNDTKKSSDFVVKDPVQNEQDPEVKALHRKLRIQKDRLASWGVEWSDPTQSAEIDESLSKAGLSEVVGSIMSTIKDILAEAEPLWLSSRPKPDANRSGADRKVPLGQWNKSHFEDLIRDLTSSIDTLYDLSRTRSMGAVPRRADKNVAKIPSAAEESRPFESTRMQTPQVVQPTSLTHLRPKQDAPGDQAAREVVFMSKTAYSELNKGTSKEPWAPFLLEYATFNSIYSLTGISPPMSKFEKLSAGLQQGSQRSPGAWTGLPRLIGYFEDMDNSRFGLLYRFPSSFNAISFERANHNPQYNLPTLASLLTEPAAEPILEAKFRLAHNLTNTVFDMHARGFTHGNLVASNISFSDAVKSGPTFVSGDVDVRRPLVSSFDVFPEDEQDAQSSLSRHPLDPRSHGDSPLSKSTDERILELYSLSLILISIGLWQPLERLTESSTIQDQLDKLAQRCGTLYMKAVHACWSAVDLEHTGECHGELLLSAVQMKVSRFLETCCILDGVSGLEDQLSVEIGDARNTDTSTSAKGTASSAAAPPVSGSKDARDIKSSSGFSKQPVEDVSSRSRASEIDVEDAPEKPGNKIKLYPNIPLPPDAVEKWNTILMPQINQALRQFYRKHPESVEISLESVGPSPIDTQPTIVVVCSSVSKVRAILKKRLGHLFEDPTGFALKVCRGHVVRSRRWTQDVVRSMARKSQTGDSASGEFEHGTLDDAMNPEYQEKPANGASIGAWIGDRHLPPVSFGGLIQIDDTLYGMTVHHMLDDPDRDFGDQEATRSSAIPRRDFSLPSGDEDEFAYELSDTESEPYSESDISSDWGDEEEEEEEEDEFEPGDIPGIEPGCGDGYIVTQPALDDVEEGFYPSPETEDEDHLDTFTLGEVYASSGIRRKTTGGLTHEVDWALFEFSDDRLPEDNALFDAQDGHGGDKSSRRLLQPSAVANFSSLPGKEVQCTARTSGLQTGKILPALTSVKIYGRTSPSHTYQVAGTASSTAGSHAPIGIPGDSGAWIVDSNNGQLCGHVLAWSQRKQVAYICPMEVLLEDIAQTLEAREIRLPGGNVLVQLGGEALTGSPTPEEEDVPPELIATSLESAQSNQSVGKSCGSMMSISSRSGSSMTSRANSVDVSRNSSFKMTSPGGMETLAYTLDDLKLGRRIDVR